MSKQMTKHTPGPWNVYRDGIIEDDLYIDCGANTLLCKVFANASLNVASDAQLIAAAPELLEAAKRALPALMHSEPRIAKALFEAIRKAEGGSNE